MVGIAPGEAALDAAMPAVGLAVFPRHHADQLFALHFGAEGAADTAIGASRDDRTLGLAQFLDALFHQRRSRAGLDAGAAADAVGREESVLGLPGANLAFEPASFDGQRERSLHFVTGAHAARASDALVGLEGEVRVRHIVGLAHVVFAVIAIAHIAQADFGRGILQFAIVVGAAGQAIERVVGDVEFHHRLADSGNFVGLGVDHHARHDRSGAAGRSAAHAIDFDQAHPARSEGVDAVGRTETGDRAPAFTSRAHHAGAGRNGHFAPVDGQRDLGVREDLGRAEIGLPFIAHDASPLPPGRLAC